MTLGAIANEVRTLLVRSSENDHKKQLVYQLEKAASRFRVLASKAPRLFPSKRASLLGLKVILPLHRRERSEWRVGGACRAVR
jgi:hypothetical protein